MYQISVNKAFRTLILITAIAAPSSWAVDRVLIDMGFSEGSGEIELYLQDKPSLQLLFNADQKLNVSSKEAQFLQTHFTQLSQGDLDKFKSTLFEQDDTRASIVEYLETNPKAYSRYSKLQAVSSDSSIMWGPYTVHSLIMSAKDGKKFNWREVTFCEANCYVSNMLDRIDYEDELFIESIEHFKDSLKTNSFVSSKKSNFSESISLFPSNFENFKNTKQYPVRFYLKPKPLDSGSFSFSQCSKTGELNDLDVRSIATVLCAINEFNPEKETENQLLKRIGIQMQDSAMIPLIKGPVVEGEAKTKSRQTTNFNSPLYKTLLPITEFFKTVKSWEGVNFKGKIFKEKRGVVYFTPATRTANGFTQTQSIGLVRHGKKRQILLVSEYALGQIPVSAYASRFFTSETEPQT